MADPGAYRDPQRIVELINANAVTTLQGVPTLLQALADVGGLDTCTSLTHLFSGGEALSRRLAATLLDQLPGVTLVNLYGPSECTINTSAHAVDRAGLQVTPEIIPIGQPVHGTRYEILDRNGRRCAEGETGELYIAGVQLARGYLHRPDLTEERFTARTGDDRQYRTGDLVRATADGEFHFVGRVDNQVKLRGFRVELDEIKIAVERHDWVKRAEVVVREDARTGQNLVAFIELDPDEAALMDQGNHAAHHQSKRDKRQIKAQLSSLGIRPGGELAGRQVVRLPGRESTPAQRRTAFGRKTYRFYEGGPVTRADLERLLASAPPAPTGRRLPHTLSLRELGELLRNFGQFTSPERLLPKYAYASPGSLYATQLHVEISGVAELPTGCYYYHPTDHTLVLLRSRPTGRPEFRVHLVGRRRAIETVYRNNVREVLQIEAGHMAGLFDVVLPAYGLGLGPARRTPAVRDRLDCAADDVYLASFDVQPGSDPGTPLDVELYVQAHPGRIADLPSGNYRHTGGDLQPVSAELVLKRHVIAINQQPYEQASFGLNGISRHVDEWLRYTDLGRALQRLQHNDQRIGLMSSGYSSQTGLDLPSARRIVAILGETGAVASYFAIGGRVSEAQWRSEGMKEDAVHTRGPAEMIRDDLAAQLPNYMVPNRVHVLGAFPLGASGKVDTAALRDLDAASVTDVPVIAPRTTTEESIAFLWQQALKTADAPSVHDDFFAVGGNSLVAVALIGQINRKLGCALPAQVLFESPTIEALARRVDRDPGRPASRLVALRAEGDGPPVYCWPGLGGYPMRLRLLAGRLPLDRPFVGVQAHGINAGERPYPTVAAMAERDVELIRRHQPTGPYTLWGYSFGCRVAFEAAYQLEQAGETVAQLLLIAPGRPRVEASAAEPGQRFGFGDPAFVSILFSVFAGGLPRPLLQECLAATRDEDSFVAFVRAAFEHLDEALVRRIVGVVRQTFQFEYAPGEIARRRLHAPVTVLRASGDEISYADSIRSAGRGGGPLIRTLSAGHYALLRPTGIDELVAAVAAAPTNTDPPAERTDLAMPHVSIKHFPADLGPDQTSSLVAAIAKAVGAAFACDEGVVSIALEPVNPDAWNERVYLPEILNAPGTLVKAPNY
jgi:acyl-CoA synthetase (AMP-forming)/AMP-acid ligase II/pimeloyl-ACP methyl ester carboxylesterase/acyl carrier protein